MTFPPELLSVLQFVWEWGWAIAPIALFLIWRQLWYTLVRERYASAILWTTLELKIPNVVERTPKAMEQVFGGLHSMRTSINFKEKWWDGKHQQHISMEIVGAEGSTRFFIHVPVQYQKLVQSQLYAQYKDIEITEVEDYAMRLPPNIPNEEYEIWGTELMFTKPDAYPIRTYRFFEEPSTEKKFIDPLASLVEVLGELSPDEQIWTHILIRPTGDQWQIAGQRLIDRLVGRRGKQNQTNFFEGIIQFFIDLALAIIVNPGDASKTQEKQVPETLMQHLTPGTKDTVAALEESISKHGFEAVIRLVYIARTHAFSEQNISALLGAFKQFSTYNLNGFTPNFKITPSVDYFFKKTRELSRKQAIYQWARERSFKNVSARKRMIMNTEELATIYHVPSIVLEVPTLPKITAKKSEPPTGLPMI